MKISSAVSIFLFCSLALDSSAGVLKASKPTTQREAGLDCANDQYWNTQDRCAALEGEAERKATSLEFKKKYGSVWSREMFDAVEKLQKLVREFSQLEAAATNDSVHGEYSHIENEVWQRWLKDVVQQMEAETISGDESKAVQDSDKKLNAIYAKGFSTSESCKNAQRLWLKVRDEIAKIYQLRFKNKFDPKTLKDIAVKRATLRRVEDYQRRLDL